MDILEHQAAIQHEIWSHWMRYQFSVGTFLDNGIFILPKDKVERWSRQMNTPYEKLSESEKESDRNIVRDFGVIPPDQL